MIALDTNIIIYALDSESELCSHSRKIIGRLEDGKESAVSSVLVLTEIMRKSRPGLLDAVKSIPNLEYRQTDENIAILAADLSNKYPKLKAYDEIHLATAIISGANKFYTNDLDILRSEIKEITVQGLK